MENKNVLAFSSSIVLVSVLIAIAILISRGVEIEEIQPSKSNEVAIRAVTASDHLLGNPDADIILIEYSDFECPYCREFHVTMKRIMEEFGKEGKIAWVYRHFPLQSLINGVDNILESKPDIASECVASIGGEEKFWDFLDIMMLESVSPISDDYLRQTALRLEIPEDDFNVCMVSGRFNAKIERDIDDGLAIYEFDSNFGTPYNIIVTKTGTQMELSGSQTYSDMKELINNFAFPGKLEFN